MEFDNDHQEGSARGVNAADAWKTGNTDGHKGGE